MATTVGLATREEASPQRWDDSRISLNRDSWRLAIWLQVKGDSAPGFRFHVSDRLRESPPVPMEIFCTVLPFAVYMIFRIRHYSGAHSTGTPAMRVYVINSHLQATRVVRHHIALSNSEAASVCVHLYAVIRDAKPNRETESVFQPGCCDCWIWIAKNGNDRARWDRTIDAHWQPRSSDYDLIGSGVTFRFRVDQVRFRLGEL